MPFARSGDPGFNVEDNAAAPPNPGELLDMKRTLLFCLWAVGCALFIAGCASSPSGEPSKAEGDKIDHLDRATKLMLHYPSVKYVKDNSVYFVDGASLPFDDQQVKDLKEKLENADIEDHFTQVYPAFAPIVAPALDSDPGRFRNDAFLKKLYGAGKQDIESNLVEITWMPVNSGKKLLFNKNENAAAQLLKVSAELDQLPKEHMKYIVNIDSTYDYRPIEGTNRLSPHSYGIAIDLEVKYTCYWLWDKEYNYRNEIPREVVEIFEKHGFVWGGRWYHYDTMHFEYRPEMFERVL
jgi:hypothetical protein